jgi:hypothetical protein
MKTYFLLTMLLAASTAFASIETTWQRVKEKNGVVVFRGDVAGSNVVAFRGVSVIDAPIGNVVSVIYDVSRIKEWMSDLESSRVVEKKAIFTKIEYNRTKAPWPLADRDFVYSVDVKVNKADKSVDILIENATHVQAPEVPGVVRGELRSSRYFLQAIEGNTKTQIEVEILADPKGSIPKWVVNLFQRGWPSNTINGIRKIAVEPNYKIHPDIANYLKELESSNKK